MNSTAVNGKNGTLAPKVAKGISKLQRHAKTGRSWGCNSTNLLELVLSLGVSTLISGVFMHFWCEFFLGKRSLVEVVWFENGVNGHNNSILIS